MLVTEQSKIDKYYNALIERKEDFVGIFYVGVKTTSVFCIATCRARKPKLKNVEFYTSFKEALENGYRPCKICKPTENANEAPIEVKKAIELVKKNPHRKTSDEDLRLQGLHPVKVRRWFKRNYGITFQAFQRMYRLNDAYLELKKGKITTHTAYDSGYESLSGFSYTFKKLLGHSPSNSERKEIIHSSRLTSPLGPILICSSSKGIVLVEFADKKDLEKDLLRLQQALSANMIFGENNHILTAKKQLQEYFLGDRQKFDLSLDPQGSDFQKEVWNALLELEYADSISYKEVALKIEKPKAFRAVANANGKNKIAIIIPCHRVIGSNGRLSGYAWGVERKKWLLEHEMKNMSNLQENI